MKKTPIFIVLLLMFSLCFSADAPGCNSVLGSAGTTYTMNMSKTANATNCYNITAANIALDCAGWSITGNNTSFTYGIYSEQPNTTIRNCNISNFATQIYLAGATNGAFISNTLLPDAGKTRGLLYLDGSASGNLFYWNNFTNTSGYYVQDLNGSNYYNTTLSGQPAGNIWYNMENGSVDIYGSVLSPFFGFTYGAFGHDYPYNNSSSSGKLNGNVVDYAPLSPNVITGTSCVALNKTNKYYVLYQNVTTASGNCFTPSAANITLDCKGNSVVGGNEPNTYGFLATSFNSSIKNCNIYNFSTTIKYENITKGNVQSCNLYPNAVMPSCSNYSGTATCTEIGCTAISGTCVDAIPEVCSQLADDVSCKEFTPLVCEWDGSICTRKADQTCDININEASCTDAQCLWNLPQCTGTPYDCNTQNACKAINLQNASSTTILNTTGTSQFKIMSSSGISISNASVTTYNQTGLDTAYLNNSQVSFTNITSDKAGAIVHLGNNVSFNFMKIAGNESPALYFNYTQNSVVNNSHIETAGLTKSFIMYQSNYSQIINSNISQNLYSTTFSCGGVCTALYMEYGYYNNITNTSIFTEQGPGILLYLSEYARIINDTFSGKFDVPLYFLDANHNTVIGMNGYGSNNTPIRMGQSSYNNISNSNLTSGAVAAVCVMSGSSYNTFTNITATSLASNSPMSTFSGCPYQNAIRFTGADNTDNNVGNAVINSTIVGNASYPLYIDYTTNSQFYGNTIISLQNNTLLYVNASRAGNNTFYLNNFTATNGYYVQDLNGSNYYNTTITSQPAGNMYANVLNGSVQISGTVLSPFTNLYYGSGGAGYPYGNSTSQGKFSCFNGCADYAPLTQTYLDQINLTLNGSSANISYIYGPAYALSVIASSSSGTQMIYLNGTAVGTANYSVILGAGFYNITANSSGNLNYTNATQSYFAIVAQDSSNITLNATGWSVQSGAATTVNCTIDNAQSPLYLYRNNVKVNNSTSGGSISDIQTLTAGAYNYTCNSTASQNYSLAEARSSVLTVAAAPSPRPYVDPSSYNGGGSIYLPYAPPAPPSQPGKPAEPEQNQTQNASPAGSGSKAQATEAVSDAEAALNAAAKDGKDISHSVWSISAARDALTKGDYAEAERLAVLAISQIGAKASGTSGQPGAQAPSVSTPSGQGTQGALPFATLLMLAGGIVIVGAGVYAYMKWGRVKGS